MEHAKARGGLPSAAVDRHGPLAARSHLQRLYHFDRFGGYLGYLDEVGHYHDKTGIRLGAVSGSGAFFDGSGVYRGRIDVQGQYRDEHGVHRGYFRASRPAEPANDPRSEPPLPQRTRSA